MAFTKKLGSAVTPTPASGWKSWTDPTEFPAYVSDENTIRSDYQYHPDKLKDQVYTLIDELDASVAATTATKTEVDQLHEAGAVKADFEKLHNITATAAQLNDVDNKYKKPNTGIPSSDMASAVQTSLGKADTALQSHQDISGKQNRITASGLLKGAGRGSVSAAGAADVPGFAYTTTAPVSANTDGIKVCVLSSEPATKYSGWLYLITE